MIAIIAILVSLLVPGLRGARESGRLAACLSNQRQLGAGWAMYADASRGRAMPLGYASSSAAEDQAVYWWGSHGSATSPPDFCRGFIAPYLDASLRPGSVFECPSQPWGTYRAQGPNRSPTSTYGYNGYFLSPAAVPGWSDYIGSQRWQRVGEIVRATELAVFGDSLLSASPLPRNCALLDPPLLFMGRAAGWVMNPSPTTAFRHATSGGVGAAAVAHADLSARAHRADAPWLVDVTNRIGSVGGCNDPAYVPDWRDWR